MKIFLFDIDGTLIHSGGAGRAALDVALRKAFQVETENKLDLGGRTDRGIVRELFAAHDIPLNETNWRRFQEAYLAALPDRLKERPGGVLPGVVEALDAIAAFSELGIGLLTGNVQHGARIKLSHYGLWERFRFGGFGDEHECRDDVARTALEAASDLAGQEVQGEQICVVGDTLLDIRCARAIGAQVVAVCTGAADREKLAAAEPDLLVDDLRTEADWWKRFA